MLFSTWGGAFLFAESPPLPRLCPTVALLPNRSLLAIAYRSGERLAHETPTTKNPSRTKTRKRLSNPPSPREGQGVGLRSRLVIVSSATATAVVAAFGDAAALQILGQLEADVLEHHGRMVVDLHGGLHDGGHAVDKLRTLYGYNLLEHGGDLGLEVDAALLHQCGGAACLGVAAGTRYAYLEDADAFEADLLPQLEVVLEGGTQLVEDGLDVRALHGALSLDEVGQLTGGDETVVVDRAQVVLAEGLRQLVGVHVLLKFLTHLFVSFLLF